MALAKAIDVREPCCCSHAPPNRVPRVPGVTLASTRRPHPSNTRGSSAVGEITRACRAQVFMFILTVRVLLSWFRNINWCAVGVVLGACCLVMFGTWAGPEPAHPTRSPEWRAVWGPHAHRYGEPFRTLRSFTDPALNACRGIIPPIGGIDISPSERFSAAHEQEAQQPSARCGAQQPRACDWHGCRVRAPGHTQCSSSLAFRSPPSSSRSLPLTPEWRALFLESARGLGEGDGGLAWIARRVALPC